MRILLTLALLLLPIVADAQARQISALYVSQSDGKPPAFMLRALDGPPKTVTVRDQATGKVLGTNRGFVECTVGEPCGVLGVLYGPHEHPARPAGLFQPADPLHWSVWGNLKGIVVDGQLLRVSIDGRRAIILECAGVGSVHCARR